MRSHVCTMYVCVRVMHSNAVCCYCCRKQTCTSVEICCTHVKHDLCQTTNNSVAYCHNDGCEFLLGVHFSKTYTWILIYYVIVHEVSEHIHPLCELFFQSCIKFIAFDFKCESKALPRRQCIFSNIWFFILWIRTLIGTIASIFCRHKIMLK